MQKALECNGEEGEGMKKKLNKNLREEALAGKDLMKEEATRILDETEASLIAALSNLKRLCVRGEVDAAKMLSEFSLICTDLLGQGLNSRKLPEKHALEQAARTAQEWPISCPAIVDRRKQRLEEQIPAMLGEDLNVRLGESTGRGGRRNLDPVSRTGFASSYQNDLEWGRQFARKHALYSVGYFAKLKEQGEAADSVRNQPHLFKDPEGPLLNADSIPIDSIGDLLKIGDAGPEVDWIKLEDFVRGVVEPLNDEGLFDEMATVGPEGIERMWRTVANLPDFCAETMKAWVCASLKLARIRCGGKWASGPWRETYKDQARKRLIVNGGNEKKAYRYVVMTLLKGGYPQLLKNSTQKD